MLRAPKRAPPVLEPPPPLPPTLPKTLNAGWFAVPLPPPSRLPDARAVVLLLPPQNSPPLAGAGDAEAVLAVGVVEPKRPPVEGVVEVLPPKRAPVEGVAAVPEGAPNRTDFGFSESPLLGCPKTEPALPADVDELPAAAPPNDPKENLGVLLPEAEPKRPSVAGAEVVVLFDCSFDELGVPKLNDMVVVTGEDGSLDSLRMMCRS